MRIRSDIVSSIRESQHRQRVVDSTMSMLENLRDQLDPQMKDWMPTGTQGDTMPREVNSDPSTLRQESKRAFYQEPYGKVVIRNMVKFIIGSGTIINWSEKNERKLQSILKWWKKSTKSIKWFSFQREYVTRFFRDGEVFVRKFATEEGPLKLRFIDPALFSDDDIVTDPSDSQTVIKYIMRVDGKPIEIPAEEIHHLKNADANMKRGRPLLESILPYITKFKKWLDARIVLNQVRTSVALVQEVQGTSTDLLRLANRQKASDRGRDGDRAKMLQPGTIIRGTPGSKYSMLSPNLDAKDASEDGRTIQLAMAAGAGFPDTFITGDFSKANFASSVVAQNPAIREFEDGQQLIVEGIVEIIDWILLDGINKNEIAAEADIEYEVGFPPLLKRDMAQETAAYEVMHANRVISRATWQIKSGLDPDAEDRKTEEDSLSLMNKPSEVPEPKISEPPSKKRVDDRNPRQTTAGNESQKKKIRLKLLPLKEMVKKSTEEDNNETLRNYEMEYEVIRPEQSTDPSGEQAA